MELRLLAQCGDIFAVAIDRWMPPQSRSPSGRPAAVTSGSLHRRHYYSPLPSEKGATTSDNLAKIMLSHQPHTLLGQTNILNARCEVHGDREPCVVALHACRLLPMKSFPDVDRRFVHRQFMEERTCLTASLI
jgi:hypothetical protein